MCRLLDYSLTYTNERMNVHSNVSVGSFVLKPEWIGLPFVMVHYVAPASCIKIML